MARRALAHRSGESDRRQPPGLGQRFIGQRTVTLDMLNREIDPRSESATSLPVFGCRARGTAKRLREMALVGETCLERDKGNGFLAK